MSFSLLHPRDQIVAIMERIYGHDMTTTSGGNVSVRDDAGDIWITPARVDKGNLRRQDIVAFVRTARDGVHPPSSESPFHLSIYAARSDIQAIIHAHPGALVSFSICGQAPEHLPVSRIAKRLRTGRVRTLRAAWKPAAGRPHRGAVCRHGPAKLRHAREPRRGGGREGFDRSIRAVLRRSNLPPTRSSKPGSLGTCAI